jgi:hypothetical protein
VADEADSGERVLCGCVWTRVWTLSTGEEMEEAREGSIWGRDRASWRREAEETRPEYTLKVGMRIGLGDGEDEDEAEWRASDEGSI